MLRGVSAAAGLLALAAGLATATWSGPADAEVRTNIRYTGYKVYGATAQEIWRDIGRKGPHQPERGLYAQAEAEIRFGWNVAFASSQGACRVKSAVVNVDVTILLPDWADKGRGSQALRQAWGEYIAKVRRHEDYHKDIALVAAKEIDRAIQATPAHRDCKSLERTIKAKTDNILAKERAQQAHFDRTDRPIMLTGGR
jgi:predicted secreted Zn-dependent protease